MMIGPLAGQLGPMGVATSKPSYAYGVVLPLAPIAYYPLMGNANDLSGNGYNATPTNITWNAIAGPGASMGSAPSFNGVSSKIVKSSLSVNLSNDGALFAWVYVIADKVSKAIFFTNLASGNCYRSFQTLSTSKIYSGYDGDAGVGSPAKLPVGRWIPLGYRWIKATKQLTLYIDGGIVNQITSVGTPADWTCTTFNIGVGYNGSSAYWSDYIAHVQIYNYALSDAQMIDLSTAI